MSSEQKQYRGILKSSSLIGGSAFINVFIGMIRAKFAAIYLGPSGVGLLGIYQSLVAMAQTISGMGINTSGVREIAEATGSNNDDKIATTVISLRRVVWITGILGLLVLAFGSAIWSWFSFGNYDHSFEIALLSSIILMASITMGQSCLLQGTRRIADLARIGVLGAILGTTSTIPCYYYFGQNGIIPSMILAAFATLMTTWWFARRVPIKNIPVSWKKSREVTFELLYFGLPIMLAGFLTMLTFYLIRVLVIRQIGLDGAGIYQAAFGLSGVLVNFVLQAMGTDYYPRLTAVANDNRKMGLEINAQAEIALLLALPLLAATIIFAPIAITIFYTGAFDDSAAILRWFALGIYGRIVSWPLGFVILAKKRGKTFFCTELTANILHLLLTWICISRWGLIGTGIAYAVLYSLYTFLVLIICFWLTRETWTRSNLAHIITLGCILGGLWLNCVLNTTLLTQWIISISTLAILSFYCFQRLSSKTGITFQTLYRKYIFRKK